MFAAVALMLTACSSDIQELAKPAEPKTGEGIPFSATISMVSDSPTRTLLAEGTDGKSITDTWKSGDKVALIYKIGDDTHVSEATVTPQDDKSALISGTIDDGVTDNTPVTIVYPYTAVRTDAGDNYGKIQPIFTNQKGTLDDIATNFDYRQGEGLLMVSDKATLKKAVTMASNIAIWKLTLQDESNNDAIVPTYCKIIYGSDAIAEIEGDFTSNELYLALPAVSNETLSFDVNTTGKKYIFSKTGFTLEKGKFYKSTAKMTKCTQIVNLSSLTADYVAQDGDLLTGALANNVKISIADNATVILHNVDINVNESGNRRKWNADNDGDVNHQHAGIICNGSATIVLSGKNRVYESASDYAGIQIGGNGTTLTIKGDGELKAGVDNNIGAGLGCSNAQSGGNIKIEGGTIYVSAALGAGIGSASGNNGASSCGNITISGGTIYAKSNDGAGIGCGVNSQCGDINITGGTIIVEPNNISSANTGSGIGSGDGSFSQCCNITITSGVTKVYVKKGSRAIDCIGKGETSGSCGAIRIGGIEYWNGGEYENEAAKAYLQAAELLYEP